MKLTYALLFMGICSCLCASINVNNEENKYFERSLLSRPASAPAAFDCKARYFAWQYAQTLQPWRTNIHDVFDALQLKTLCNYSSDSDLSKFTVNSAPKYKEPLSARSFYVDTTTGSDSNSGTISSPFKTIQRAVNESNDGQGATIYLREGVFYLKSPVQLGPENSYITFTNYNNEAVEINGGIPLKTSWVVHDTSLNVLVYENQNNVWGRAVSRANTSDIIYLGDFNTSTECETACLQFNDNGQICHSFVWHSPQVTGGWALQCFACTDDYWQPVADADHISGQVAQNNIYSAELSGQGISQILGMQLNGQRCTRARFPNANPEIDLFPDGYISSANKWIPPRNMGRSVTNTTKTPVRDSGVAFQQYTVGTGGPCSAFDPPESYWCSSDCAGGGASTYVVPSGLVFDESTFSGRVWKNPTTGIVTAFHPGHWENWMFAIDSYTPSNYTIEWSLGGFQGGRGSSSGGEWFVQNLFEELDAPNEYYYDETSQILYYYYNGTGAPPANSVFEASNLPVLFNIMGTQQTPVKGLTFHGLQFRNAAYTYMSPHGVPSGGDWSLHRGAALFFEGTENLLVDECLFIRLDGNALFLSGFNRNATIQKSEFVWIGDSAVAAWGYTNGIDGTAGDFPRYSQFLYNFVHETGIYTKETSGWFQSRTAQSFLQGNIIFNGPRAGVNVNDVFGGGNELTNNLMFNEVRETYDHGPFNSWDRQPFVTTIANGTAQVTPLYTLVHNNMFICNYGSEACIDNDDGSTYFKNYNNFEVYGCHKDYFAGHNKYTYDTVLVYPNCWGYSCGFFTQFEPGYVDGVWNVSCIQYSTNKLPYLTYQGTWNPDSFNPAAMPTLRDNTVYNNNNYLYIQVGSTLLTDEQWQQKGQDSGTKVLPQPSDDEIIAMGKAIMGL